MRPDRCSPGATKLRVRITIVRMGFMQLVCDRIVHGLQIEHINTLPNAEA
jgi:hypothetical protein